MAGHEEVLFHIKFDLALRSFMHSVGGLGCHRGSEAMRGELQCRYQ